MRTNKKTNSKPYDYTFYINDKKIHDVKQTSLIRALSDEGFPQNFTYSIREIDQKFSMENSALQPALFEQLAAISYSKEMRNLSDLIDCYKEILRLEAMQEELTKEHDNAQTQKARNYFDKIDQCDTELERHRNRLYRVSHQKSLANEFFYALSMTLMISVVSSILLLSTPIVPFITVSLAVISLAGMIASTVAFKVFESRANTHRTKMTALSDTMEQYQQTIGNLIVESSTPEIEAMQKKIAEQQDALKNLRDTLLAATDSSSDKAALKEETTKTKDITEITKPDANHFFAAETHQPHNNLTYYSILNQQPNPRIDEMDNYHLNGLFS